MERLAERIGVGLDLALLQRALTHRSYAYENGGLPTNERLEFLGDSVLGLVVTETLFRSHPELPEGQLAKLRAAVVNMRALPDSIAHIAHDPLDAAFDDAGFAAGLRRRRTGLKRALLDQSMVSGVGNIYADEALWRARLHWARPTETMTRPVADRVLGAVRAVLSEAVASGGTSFDALYVDVNGESGYFERSLNVYGREHEPCPRCGRPIRRSRWMNRSSYWCPQCQRRPRHPHP
jgi:formamidopyrimidine-DNA glycosylase